MSSVEKCWSNSLLALIACISVLLVSCSRADKPSTNETTGDESYSTTPPFPTKEPDTYRAIRNLTFTDSEGNSKTVRTEIARSGELRREATEVSSQPVVYLDNAQGSFILLPQDKVYADTNDESQTSSETSSNDADRRVHTEPVKVRYQRLGTEVIGDRNLAKYRVVNISGDGTVSNGENVVWVDESLGMPVKSESSSRDKSRTTMELTEISTELDQKIFEIPKDYQKTSISELRRRMHKE